MLNLTNPVKALIVDDEEIVADIVCSEIGELGIQSQACFSASQARELLSKETWDVVITDARMPQETGIQLLEWIRFRNAQIPRVIIMTAFADLTLEDAFHKGADAMIMKPFNFDTLEQILSDLLNMKDPPHVTLDNLIDLKFDGHLANFSQFIPGRGGCFIATEPSQFRVHDRLGLKITANDYALTASCLVRWLRRNALDENRQAGVGLEFISTVQFTDHTGTQHHYPWADVVPYIPTKPFLSAPDQA